MLGLVAELLFDDQLDQLERPAMRRIGWIAHLTGWVTMLSAYVGVILKQYFVSVSESDVGPSDWVTVVIFVVFGLYNIFTWVRAEGSRGSRSGVWNEIQCVCRDGIRCEQFGH